MGILVGVTRNSVMEIAEKEGIKVEERVMTRYDIYTADESFLTGSAAEIIPVVEIDRRPIGDGKVGNITKKLIKLFREYVKTHGEVIPR
jgi:branched-chain amino acid aminotransferase